MSVLDTIRRLHALATDQAGTPEGETARRIVEERRKKHNISDADLAGWVSLDKNGSDEGDIDEDTWARTTQWRIALAALVALAEGTAVDIRLRGITVEAFGIPSSVRRVRDVYLGQIRTFHLAYLEWSDGEGWAWPLDLGERSWWASALSGMLTTVVEEALARVEKVPDDSVEKAGPPGDPPPGPPPGEPDQEEIDEDVLLVEPAYLLGTRFHLPPRPVHGLIEAVSPPATIEGVPPT